MGASKTIFAHLVCALPTMVWKNCVSMSSFCHMMRV